MFIFVKPNSGIGIKDFLDINLKPKVVTMTLNHCCGFFLLIIMQFEILEQETFFDNFKEQSYQIHFKAKRQFNNQIKGFVIPLCLTPNYSEEGIVLLDLIKVENDICYYSYSTTAS